MLKKSELLLFLLNCPSYCNTRVEMPKMVADNWSDDVKEL